ncbi:MAG: hypothetical protein A2157_18280 [Deltaproteobacteria bacterium RBG_16_47_11]|nr:MAG: hypothetical protein A2157_18280 [Deltaproteobacteria bacterium RBG_16_47_11]
MGVKNMSNQQNKELRNYTFKGRVLLVYLMNAPNAFLGGVVISNPKTEELFGRTFLIGDVPSTSNDWAAGSRIGIAFDQVSHFLEFSDENEYLEKSSIAGGQDTGRSLKA